VKSLGVPIGYELFPGCTRQTREGLKRDGNCAIPAEEKADGILDGVLYNISNNFVAFLLWLISVALGGLLIGLGAPFWFDVARGLSRSLQVMKALTPGTKSAGEEQQVATPSAAAGASPPPRTPVEAFNTAIAALPN
jgi:hypothetical protein